MNKNTLLTTLLLSASLAVPPAMAADKTWDGGGGNGTWTAANNWDLNTAPVANDSLFFAGAVQTSTNNDFAANTQFNGLTFNAEASSFTLAGNAINLAGNITNSSSVNQTINLALALQQNVIVNTGSTGNATSGGTTLGGIISGTGFSLEKTGSGRLSLSNANTFSGGVRVSEGTLNVFGNNAALGTGAVTFGSATGTENVLLTNEGDRTYSNNIIVAAGSGTRTIRSQTGNMGLSGTIFLFNDVTLDTASASNRVSLSSVAGNKTITVTDSGGGADVAYVEIGGSASRNAFTGNVQVQTGARFNASNSPARMDLSGASLTLASSANFTYGDDATVGGLNGVAGGATQMNSGSAKGLTLGGSGTYSFAGNLTNTGAGAGGLTVRLSYGGEKGTQTFSGTSSLTGGTAIQAGKLILDYSTNNTSKLNDTGAMTMRGGTIELAGGSHNEVVASTNIQKGGQANISRTSGSSTIALGALSWSSVGVFGASGVLNFSGDGIATTTSTNTRGILGSRARFTVGGANWAINDGANNIVALASYDTFVGSGGDNAKNYLLSGSGIVTANQSFNTLKIATTGSGQSLALGNRTLGFNNSGVLFTGADDYAITTSEASGALSGSLILHNYGSGVLTLGRLNGETFEHAGTGKTVLTTASGYTGTGTYNSFFLDSGTVQFSASNQLGGPNSSAKLSGGMLVADTAGGSFSLTNNAGHRNIQLGTDVPTIDVIGGNTVTIGGVISSDDTLVTSIVFGSASSNGTISLTGTNTYTGDTRIAGGRLSVNSATSLGSTSGNYKVVFSGNSTLNTTANIATSRYYDIYSGVTGTIETDASTTLTHNGTIAGAGNLRKAGAGTLTISGTSTYTGATTISAGTLLLDATGSIASSSGINLGTAGSQGTLDITAKSAYTLNAGQTLTGYGTVNIGTGKTLTIAGNLAPGNSPGITTITGGLALTGTSGTTMELGGLTVGTEYDRVVVSESLAFGGTLNIVSINGWNINQAATYDLFNFASSSGNFTSVTVGGFGLTFDNVDTYTGNNGGIIYTFTLADGALTVVPEPAAWMLLAFAGTLLVVTRNRRRRH